MIDHTRWRRPLALAAILAAGLGALAGCGGGDDSSSPPADAPPAAEPSAPSEGTRADSEALFDAFAATVGATPTPSPDELTAAEQAATAVALRSAAAELEAADQSLMGFRCAERMARAFVSYMQLSADWYDAYAAGDSFQADEIGEDITVRSANLQPRLENCRTVVSDALPGAGAP